MNTRKLSLIAAALMLFSLFAVSAMAADQDRTKVQQKLQDGSCTTLIVDSNGDGICDNFVDEDGDGVCDNCPNGGDCDGTGPHGPRYCQ
ncbi:hypothetical protein RE474_01895 [Methanolobus sediminis]|uniref:Uncharacterized protein n=1 Tax=Methanolobus sediminis TaxID=3072978 RepID=A0AA51YJE8_9EURY|nr:hypothetical protein [Methanolobus sediminis]WMW25495.1 hypothetical protein RE474_01895 [Methanolobus sediminis]